MRKLIIGLFLFIAAVSCKTQYDTVLEGNDADAKYKLAFEYFNNKKYTRAASLFESLASLTSGTSRDDTVQFYWGLSNYYNYDFVTAQTNFEKFVDNYSNSPLVERASFMKIDCLYKSTLRYELDQRPTYATINAIGQYLTAYPEGENAEMCRIMLADLGERLDRKAYEAAKLYYKMEDYKASRVAFKNILKNDSDNLYREDILYYSAMSSYNYAFLSIKSKQKERYLVFVDDYLNFIGEYPESNYRKELDAIYAKVKELI